MGEVLPPPKTRILRARDVDLLPFRLEYVDETYHGWLNDGEIVKYLEAQFVDRSMSALRDYVQSIEENPNRSFYLVVHRESGRRVGTGSPRITQMDFHFDDLLDRFCYKNQCNTIITTC